MLERAGRRLERRRRLERARRVAAGRWLEREQSGLATREGGRSIVREFGTFICHPQRENQRRSSCAKPPCGWTPCHRRCECRRTDARRIHLPKRPPPQPLLPRLSMKRASCSPRDAVDGDSRPSTAASTAAAGERDHAQMAQQRQLNASIAGAARHGRLPARLQRDLPASGVPRWGHGGGRSHADTAAATAAAGAAAATAAEGRWATTSARATACAKADGRAACRQRDGRADDGARRRWCRLAWPRRARAINPAHFDATRATRASSSSSRTPRTTCTSRSSTACGRRPTRATAARQRLPRDGGARADLPVLLGERERPVLGDGQMESPLDYTKKFGCWAQDKWAGTFMIKWTFIKDIPNAQFRHILLSNNENAKPSPTRATRTRFCSSPVRSVAPARPALPRGSRRPAPSCFPQARSCCGYSTSSARAPRSSTTLASTTRGKSSWRRGCSSRRRNSRRRRRRRRCRTRCSRRTRVCSPAGGR